MSERISQRLSAHSVTKLSAFLLVALSLSGLACSKRVAEVVDNPPHPFPDWVSRLEMGATDVEAVRERFGVPQEIETRGSSELVWRYAYPEIHWPEGERPDSATSGAERVRSGGSWSLSEVGRSLNGYRRRLSNSMTFPPVQPRAKRGRRLPARIHALEVVFAPDGLLREVHYQPTEGLVEVPDRS